MIVKPCLTPQRLEKRQNGRRFKENGEPMFTLTAQDRHGILTEGEGGGENQTTNPERVFQVARFS